MKLKKQIQILLTLVYFEKFGCVATISQISLNLYLIDHLGLFLEILCFKFIPDYDFDCKDFISQWHSRTVFAFLIYPYLLRGELFWPLSCNLIDFGLSSRSNLRLHQKFLEVLVSNNPLIESTHPSFVDFFHMLLSFQNCYFVVNSTRG